MGFENILLRNVLFWRVRGNFARIKIYSIASFNSRIQAGLILTIPLIIYITYISNEKLNGGYFLVLLAACGSALLSSLLSSASLIMLSENHYIISSMTTVFIPLLVRILSLIVFMTYGFNAFILTFFCAPLFGLMASFFQIHKKLKILTKLNLLIIRGFKRNKSFIFSSYLNLIKNMFDMFIISLVMSPEIFSSYALAKRAEEFLRISYDSIFDPVIQKIVAFKNDKIKLYILIRKINIYQFIFSAVIFSAVVISAFYISDIINIFKLDKYPHIKIFTIISLISGIIYGFYKTKLTAFHLLQTPSFVFRLDLYMALISVCIISIPIFFIRNEWIIYFRLINAVILFFIVINYFNNFFSKQYKSLI
jgi:hypothetical protein